MLSRISNCDSEQELAFLEAKLFDIPPPLELQTSAPHEMGTVESSSDITDAAVTPRTKAFPILCHVGDTPWRA